MGVQSYAVLDGKENFWDDYGCGVAVPTLGTVGCASTTLAMGGVVVTSIIALISVATAAGAGAEGVIMGLIAAAIGAGTVAFLGAGCMVAPCVQQVK